MNKYDEKKLGKFRKYLRKPRTMEQIQNHLDTPLRTVYRWFNLMEQEGKMIVRYGTRPTQYELKDRR